MPEDAVRNELLLLLGRAMEEPLSDEQERRLHEIMLRFNPGYHVLRGQEWVDAGFVLAGAWRLAEALAEGSE